MLTDIVILPSALADGAASLDARVSVIADLKDGAVLLVDDQGEGLKAIFAEVDRWPSAYREKARHSLKRLYGRRRIVRLPVSRKHRVECAAGCNSLHAVARAESPAIRICGSDCCAQNDGCRSVDIAEYSVSGAADELRATSLQLSEHRHTVDDLEHVLASFLRRAMTLTVFDRYVGRSASERYLNGHGDLVADRWDISLRTILATFGDAIRKSRVNNPSAVVLTGVWDDARPDVVADGLRRWAERASREFGFPVAVDARLERQSDRKAQLEHDRYLITEQGTLSSSKGFDIVATDRQMKEMGRSPLTDARPIFSTLLSLVPSTVEAPMKAKELPEAAR